MKTAVEFIVNELLYLDNEIDMKLINKNEYYAKRKKIIEQANKIFEEQIKDAWFDGVANWDSEKNVEDYIKETFKTK